MGEPEPIREKASEMSKHLACAVIDALFWGCGLPQMSVPSA
jgi:hypothetical protein